MDKYFGDINDISEIFSAKIELDMEIPECMPKYTSDDIFSLFDVRDPYGSIKEGILREHFVQHGMFGFVSWKWVNPFVEWFQNRKCLEVMAGRGWLSHALRQKNIDCIATDNFSWHSKDTFNTWNDTVTDIEKLDAVESVKKYGKEVDIVIICWAYMDDTAYEVIKTLYQVNPEAIVVYIGEGSGGCTASDSFFKHFEEIDDESFESVAVNYERWFGLHDKIKIGKYK